ncbi:hypothetical protein OPV22_023022 [Ensete ventricosum]|uniref:ALG11 mannosyltransferase N-terminal domain-containing protein n=1 Tax=Ensete ventricosum TaxID=4639 RepID=A0AAV8QMK1_ENSVE|nr:hypothetical protein OPV22_023022 [Ensete ventricosum]
MTTVAGRGVLWCSVRAMQEENPDLDCAVFSGDDAPPQSLAARALDQFSIKLLQPPQANSLQLEAFAHAVGIPDQEDMLQFVGSCRNMDKFVVFHSFDLHH